MKMKSDKMRPKSRGVSSGLAKKKKRSIHVKGSWTAVQLDPSIFSEEGLEGLVCFEELASYSLVDSDKAAATAARELRKKEEKKMKRKAKDKAKKRKASEGGGEGGPGVEGTEGEEPTEPPKKKVTNKNKNKKQAAKESVPEDVISTEQVGGGGGEGGPGVEGTEGEEPTEPPKKKVTKNNKKQAAKESVPEDVISTKQGGGEEGPGVEGTEGEEPTEPPKKKVTKKNKKQAVKESVPEDVILTEKTQEDGAANAEGGPEEDTAKEDPQQNVQAKKSNKMKNKVQKQPIEEEDEKQTNLEAPPELQVPEIEKSSQKKVTNLAKKKNKNWTNVAQSGSEDQKADVEAWKDLFVPSPVLKALSSLGFGSPTPIQALALPSAIRDRMDILGAAETGSGKTLAFGIPMIHAILEWRKGSDEPAESTSEPAPQVESLYLPSLKSESDAESETEEDNVEAVEEDDEGVSDQDQGDSDDLEEGEEDEGEEDDEDDGDEDQTLGCVKVIEDAEFDLDEEAEEKPAGGRNQPLLGLVLTPTRELAVQVKHHIDAVAKFTDIKTAIIVGGMAQQKQRRMLKRRPEIVIATPGRLWDLIKEKHPHLLNLRQLKCLVIDEADRMVERGHFAELENLLEMLKTVHFNPTRQTFVFSATLTMAHSLPTRLLQKKKRKNMDQRGKLEVLMEKVGIKSKPKIIDLTRKEATVETLTETRIHCQKEEKDFYLYYFLLQFPGRTMVFANSIDCIKRLNSLLVILEFDPLPLHANMHQKQRLKNLERFAERENCVLLTTDVAARGLDIPNIQHVIHYQVPRTSETYVHRSGRTARATKEGLSLLVIGPDDVLNFRKIYNTLGKDEDLPMFPVESKCMEAIKERVNLARSIEKIEFHNGREKQHNSWFAKAAEALEVDLDDDLLLGGPKDEDGDREQQKMVKSMKKHLKHLRSQPVFKNLVKTRYPTQMGKLALPNLPRAGLESALTKVSIQQKEDDLKKCGPPQPGKKKLRKEQRKEQRKEKRLKQRQQQRDQHQQQEQQEQQQQEQQQ
ncbi:ATP-dependent RNA helicase DDX24 [Limanda limanda]|uniref:ATP-dependent RNA helicase DDX24 n=1 Tax=Limanda limanda TaxID=27771 RepID=UPI0029C8B5BF|nr:ATP-dependent RNA helicase DDX24 [Limanda limanda]